MAKITELEIADLNRYADLKVSVKAQTKEMEGLKPNIRTVLERVDAENTPVETEVGKFSLRPRRIWTYSEELTAEIKRIEAAKLNEQGTGKGEFQTVFDVYFK